MSMMNLRRRSMSGKKLPYDAEIEYLESTSTQWIDTGINPRGGATFDMEVGASARDANNGNIFIGNYMYNVGSPRQLLNVTGAGKWNTNGGTLSGDAVRGDAIEYGDIYQLQFITLLLY